MRTRTFYPGDDIELGIRSILVEYLHGDYVCECEVCGVLVSRDEARVSYRTCQWGTDEITVCETCT